MRNRFLKVFIAVLIVVLSFASISFAADEILVQKNGSFIDFTDESGNKVSPQIINDRTMVPMRKIFEEFGMEVTWDGENRTIIAENDDKVILLGIGNNTATIATNIEGIEEVIQITLDSAPIIVDGRTLVPVRFIAESLGKQVGWDAEKRCVVIIDYDFIEETIAQKAPTFYKYITEKNAMVLETFDYTLDATGKVTYTDGDDKANNGTITLNGEIDFKKNKDNLLKLALEFSLAGTGALKEVASGMGLTSGDYEMIIDTMNGIIYSTTSSLTGDFKGKWMKYPMEEAEITSFLKLFENTNVSLEDLLKLEDNELNMYSYEILNTSVNVLCDIFSDKYFNVSGSLTKTYTFEMNFEDLIKNVLSNYLLDVSDDENIEQTKEILFNLVGMTNPTLKIKATVKNGITTKSIVTLIGDISSPDSNEKIGINFKLTNTLNSYNKEVSITIPRESLIVEVGNIENV